MSNELDLNEEGAAYLIPTNPSPQGEGEETFEQFMTNSRNGFCEKITKYFPNGHKPELEAAAKVWTDIRTASENILICFDQMKERLAAAHAPAVPVSDAVERILCAAIWYKDLPTSKQMPDNISTGVVVCGRRHGDCIYTTLALSGLRSVSNGENAAGATQQGFITNTNRFVSRQEALIIANNAKQIIYSIELDKSVGLISEDLY